MCALAIVHINHIVSGLKEKFNETISKQFAERRGSRSRSRQQTGVLHGASRMSSRRLIVTIHYAHKSRPK